MLRSVAVKDEKSISLIKEINKYYQLSQDKDNKDSDIFHYKMLDAIANKWRVDKSVWGLPKDIWHSISTDLQYALYLLYGKGDYPEAFNLFLMEAERFPQSLCALFCYLQAAEAYFRESVYGIWVNFKNGIDICLFCIDEFSSTFSKTEIIKKFRQISAQVNVISQFNKTLFDLEFYYAHHLAVLIEGYDSHEAEQDAAVASKFAERYLHQFIEKLTSKSVIDEDIIKQLMTAKKYFPSFANSVENTLLTLYQNNWLSKGEEKFLTDQIFYYQEANRYLQQDSKDFLSINNKIQSLKLDLLIYTTLKPIEKTGLPRELTKLEWQFVSDNKKNPSAILLLLYKDKNKKALRKYPDNFIALLYRIRLVKKDGLVTSNAKALKRLREKMTCYYRILNLIMSLDVSTLYNLPKITVKELRREAERFFEMHLSDCIKKFGKTDEIVNNIITLLKVKDPTPLAPEVNSLSSVAVVSSRLSSSSSAETKEPVKESDEMDNNTLLSSSSIRSDEPFFDLTGKKNKLFMSATGYTQFLDMDNGISSTGDVTGKKTQLR